MKTYSERRQDALFAAARVYLSIAIDALEDDISQEALCGAPPSLRQLEWSRDLAKRHALRAAEFENEAHEQCVASNRREAALSRLHSHYSDCISAHVALRKRLYPGVMFDGTKVA